jgi:hypothetical protein
MRNWGTGILRLLMAGFVCLCPQVQQLFGCTIFVLKDQTRTFFFNNEDWSNPKTRIWFVPASGGCFGCAYVGFDDSWSQGGVNSEGLAFDWVAGFNDKWKPTRAMQKVRGNSSQRMIEICSTVGEAIEFYRTHREGSFARSRILIADRSGASVIIGYKDGTLLVEESSQCRGFGYGWKTLEKELAGNPEPTTENGARILRACRQSGQYATKYSNIFDLRNGDIVLFFPGDESEVKLGLAAELKKGPHFFDLPEIRRQLGEAPRPLLNDMKRSFMDEYKPLPDKEPKVTKHIRELLQKAVRGKMTADDYTAELWKEISPVQKQVQVDLHNLGQFQKLMLVERSEEAGKRTYRYRIDFKKAAILQVFVFNSQDKLSFSQSEGTEWK